MPTYRIYFMDEGAHVSRRRLLSRKQERPSTQLTGSPKHVDGKDRAMVQGVLIVRFHRKGGAL